MRAPWPRSKYSGACPGGSMGLPPAGTPPGKVWQAASYSAAERAKRDCSGVLKASSFRTWMGTRTHVAADMHGRTQKRDGLGQFATELAHDVQRRHVARPH